MVLARYNWSGHQLDAMLIILVCDLASKQITSFRKLCGMWSADVLWFDLQHQLCVINTLLSTVQLKGRRHSLILVGHIANIYILYISLNKKLIKGVKTAPDRFLKYAFSAFK